MNSSQPKFRNYRAPVKLHPNIQPSARMEDPSNDGPLLRETKGWGREDWLLNNNNLCVKVLVIDFKKSCSFHFHLNKEEIFFVMKGTVYFEWKDTETGETQALDLQVGDSVYIPPGCPHRFSGSDEGGSAILECSTHHEDSDSYRIFPGASQCQTS